MAKKYLYDKGFTIKRTKPINLEISYVEFLGFEISNYNNLVELSPNDIKYVEMVEKLNSIDDNKLPSVIRGWINHFSLNGHYTEGFYKLQKLVYENKGIEFWKALTEHGLIPCPDTSKIRYRN